MPRLSEILPHFTLEIEAALIDAGHLDLARTVASVDLVERCGCSEPGCVTFFALEKADRPDSSDCERAVPRLRGVSCVHHYGGRIVWIEALGRPNERMVLDEQVPIIPSPNTSLERTRER
jgi:hypothetical protein